MFLVEICPTDMAMRQDPSRPFLGDHHSTTKSVDVIKIYIYIYI